MKRILITGASGGIGRALVARLATRPETQLALNSRTPATFPDLPDQATLLPGDLIVPGTAAKIVDDAAAAMDGIDILVHLCGVGLIKPTADTTDAEFSRIINVNLRTTFLVTQAACKIMAAQKSGLILTAPGTLGRAVMKNAAAYIASKYGVTGLIKSLGQEYQRAGIRFSLFFLGGVATPFWDDIGMKVDPAKMIPADTAADALLAAIDAPDHLVLSEYVLQPDSHQII